MRRLGEGLVGAAVLIAVVTVVSRVVGFIRVVVLAQTVGASCLGDVYTTANAVPNIVYEVVVGGALAAAVVPLVAGGVAARDAGAVRQTVAALTGWSLLLLLPLTLVAYLLSGPLVNTLLGSSHECADDLMRSTAHAMLLVFLVQIPVYGLTVVAQGSLQAHRRFLAPAVAPLVSSLVVIAAFLGYAQLAGDTRGSLVSLSRGGFLVLTVGTTLGVLALLLVQLPDLHRERLLVRPALRFPEGTAAKARVLAASGIVTVASQWLAYAVAIRLANVYGPEGSVVVLTLAWTVFLLPWAVLVIPISTSVFPELSGQHRRGDAAGFAHTTVGSTRVVMMSAAVGAAALAAAATPIATLMVAGAPGRSSVAALAATLTAFAPGVIGYGLQGHLSRVLAARHASHVTAVVAAAGWATGAVVAGLLARAAAERGDIEGVMAAIALGLSVGLVAMGLAMLLAVARIVGTASVKGLTRTLAAALVAAAVATVVGRWVADRLAPDQVGVVSSVVVCAVVALVVLATFLVVAAVADRRTTAAVVDRVAGRVRRPG